MTSLPIPINWKEDSYDFILVIIDGLTKMVYYKLIKITINAPRLAKIIIDLLVRHYRLLDLIVTNKSLFFILKFCSLLCYFFGKKRRLCIIFYSQTDYPTKQKNSKIEAYLQAFVNFK